MFWLCDNWSEQTDPIFGMGNGNSADAIVDFILSLYENKLVQYDNITLTRRTNVEKYFVDWCIGPKFYDQNTQKHYYRFLSRNVLLWYGTSIFESRVVEVVCDFHALLSLINPSNSNLEPEQRTLEYDDDGRENPLCPPKIQHSNVCGGFLYLGHLIGNTINKGRGKHR